MVRSNDEEAGITTNACSSASDEVDDEYYSDGQEMMVHLIQLRFMITIIMAQNHLQTVTPFPRHLATIIQPRQ
jgi:hypothetical protein